MHCLKDKMPCSMLQALLYVLAQQVPFDVDISKLASVVGLQRNTVIEYLNHLNDSKLLALIYSDNTSVKKMQKPDKIYLDNPNMLYAMATTPVKIGTARECFVVNQLSYSHKVEYGKEHGDFKIDGKWTVEVGGEGKSFAQIADMPNSYVLADDIEMPRGSKIPLWMIGMTYWKNSPKASLFLDFIWLFGRNKLPLQHQTRAIWCRFCHSINAIWCKTRCRICG